MHLEHPSRSGFSLLEVLMSIALLGMLALICSQVFMGSLRIQTLHNAEQQSLQEQRQALVRQFGGEPEAAKAVTVVEHP